METGISSSRYGAVSSCLGDRGSPALEDPMKRRDRLEGNGKIQWAGGDWENCVRPQGAYFEGD